MSKANATTRLHKLVTGQRRRAAGDALLKVIFGLGFSLLVFGFVYLCGWFAFGWQLALLFAGLFFIASTWSAWQRVDPLAGLRRLTDQELLLTLIGPAVGLHFFSPRHASAGAAVVLIGGPANVLEGLGIWASRIRADEFLIEKAANLLAACKNACPVEEIERLDAALLLKRLALIKTVPGSESSALTLTEKGENFLKGQGRKKL